MDWQQVSASDLVVALPSLTLPALLQVDWNQKPRPPGEFFTRFTPPKTRTKWTSRLKCNVYYYRVNYFCILVAVLVVAFLRRPFAFLAVAAAALTTLCWNDSFAHAASERAVLTLRRVHPPLAAALRNPTSASSSHGGRSISRSKTVHLFGQDRLHVLAALHLLSFLFIWLTSALRTVANALAVAGLLVLAHATFRSPNLKARLSSVNEEFRAVWRGYNEL